jgi:hypothetical protein
MRECRIKKKKCRGNRQISCYCHDMRDQRGSIGVSWRVVAIDNFLFIVTTSVVTVSTVLPRHHVVAIDLTFK